MIRPCLRQLPLPVLWFSGNCVGTLSSLDGLLSTWQNIAHASNSLFWTAQGLLVFVDLCFLAVSSLVGAFFVSVLLFAVFVFAITGLLMRTGTTPSGYAKFYAKSLVLGSEMEGLLVLKTRGTTRHLRRGLFLI